MAQIDKVCPFIWGFLPCSAKPTNMVLWLTVILFCWCYCYTHAAVFSFSFITSNYLTDYSLFTEVAQGEKAKIAFARQHYYKTIMLTQNHLSRDL